MKPKAEIKLLDLTSIRAGDILLTSEFTWTSRLLVLAQRVLHADFASQGFSHARIFIDPLHTFDTRSKVGARFRTIVVDGVTEANGDIKLWSDVSQYKKIAVFRYVPEVDSQALLTAALIENTATYPRWFSFISLLHPQLKRFFVRLLGRRFSNLGGGNEKFCSSLTAHLLSKMGDIPFETYTIDELSPFKLSRADFHVDEVIKVSPQSIFSDRDEHLMWKTRAQAITGHLSVRDPDDFAHAMEDMLTIVARGTLIRESLKNDPKFDVNDGVRRVSLMDKPELSQMKHLREMSDSASALFEQLRRCSNCFKSCRLGCRSSGFCEVETLRLFSEIQSDMRE